MIKLSQIKASAIKNFIPRKRIFLWILCISNYSLAQNIDVRLVSGANDAEERTSDGHIKRNSNDLELTDDTGDHGAQSYIGMRFRNIALDPGVTIESAYIEFTVAEIGHSDATNLTLFCEDTANSLSFSNTAYNISDRTTTTASVAWSSIPEWTTVGAKKQTPDLKTIIQEIINRDDWAFDNAMTFIITGTGKRVVEAYENGTASLRPRLVITASAGSLPIELGHFNADIDGKEVDLKWSTISESNNDFFTVERSNDGENWEILSTTSGAGNSASKLDYKMTDYTPHSGLSYYRLKQTDFDGKFSYSKIETINNKSLSNLKVSVYPNPTTDVITISSKEGNLEELRIYNMFGQDVSNQVNITKSNSSNIVVNISTLPKDIYTVAMKNATAKIYKQ